MKVEEIRILSDEELKKQLESAYEALFSCRLNLSTRQLTNHREIPMVKKKIARIKSVIRERELGVR